MGDVNEVAQAGVRSVCVRDHFQHGDDGRCCSDRTLLRSAKDLGRVLALAWLAGGEGVEQWLDPWRVALKQCFSEEHAELANCVGDGLRALLEDADALDQARFANEVGLLRGKRVGVEELRAVGQRVLAFAVDPLAET